MSIRPPTSGGTLLVQLSTAGLALRPFTIVRTHLTYLVLSDQAAAAETQIGALGIAVVSEQASAAGIASLPTPVTEQGSDMWLLHEVFMSQETHLTDVAQSAISHRVDSKAMRKVEFGEDFVLVAEKATTGSGFVLHIGGRMLIKTN